MIDYDRGSWYGIHLLFRLRGSLLPRCVPAALLGACIAGRERRGCLRTWWHRSVMIDAVNTLAKSVHGATYSSDLASTRRVPSS